MADIFCFLNLLQEPPVGDVGEVARAVGAVRKNASERLALRVSDACVRVNGSPDE